MSGPEDAASGTGTAAASSIWLIPTSEWLSVFREEIWRLSRELQTEAFEPHVTVLGDIAAEVKELRDIVPRLAGGLPPFELLVSHVEGMDLHFRALYLRMIDHPRFHLLCRQAASAIDRPFSVSPYPHLSLAYGRLSADVRRDLCDNLFPRFRDVRIPFDRLALVRASSSLLVDEWRVADCRLLAG
jgi:hypothetical protein